MTEGRSVLVRSNSLSMLLAGRACCGGRHDPGPEMGAERHPGLPGGSHPRTQAISPQQAIQDMAQEPAQGGVFQFAPCGWPCTGGRLTHTFPGKPSSALRDSSAAAHSQARAADPVAVRFHELETGKKK